MTDAAVMGAISALSKKVDGLGGNEVLDLPITYTTVDKSEGVVTQNYVPFTGVLQHSNDASNPAPTVASAMLNDEIYYVGGGSGSGYTGNSFKYNVTTGKVSPIAQYPGNGINFGKAVAFQGKIAVIGGTTYQDINGNYSGLTYVYDPVTNAWTSHSQVSPQVVGSAFAYGNKIFIANALGGSSVDYVYYRDFSNTGNGWGQSAYMAGSQSGTSAQVAGTMYIFPGSGTGTWSIDMTNNAVTAKAASPIPFQIAKAAVVGTVIYLMQSESVSTNYPKVYAYDTVANTFTAKTDIPFSEKGSRIFTNGTTKIWLMRVNGQVYEYDVAGNSWTAKASSGVTMNVRSPAYMSGTSVFTPSPSNAAFWKYDTSTDSWTNVYSSPQVVQSGTVTVGTKIYSFGGVNSGAYANSSMVYDTITKAWTQLAPGPRNRSDAAVVHVNGKIYVMGGYSGSSYWTNNDIYDIATNTWSVGAARTGTTLMSASVAANGKIYATVYDRYVRIYDPVTNTWSLSSQNPVNRNSYRSVILNDKVYVFSDSPAGYDVYDIAMDSWTAHSAGTGVSNARYFVYNNTIYSINASTIMRLDTTNDSWTLVTYIEYNNFGLGSNGLTSTLVGDTVYFVGPHGLNQMATYDMAGGYWNSVAPWTNSTLSQFATASNGDELYLIGGSTTNSYGGGVNYVYRYNAKLNYWYSVANLSTGGHVSPGAAIWNNSLFVFGGANTAGTNLATVDEVNLSTGTVTAKTPMSVASSYVIAVTCGDYIWASRDSSGAFWRYNPVNDTWLQIGSVGSFYSSNSAGMVSDGEFVYFIGGSPSTRLYRFDPATYKFTTLASMPASHSGGSSTYFDGKIYVTGGQDSGAVHIYDVESNTWSNGPLAGVSGRMYGAIEHVDGKIVSMGGYYSGTATMIPAMAVESFAVAYRTLNPLAILNAGVYHSMTSGLTLSNVDSGRSGDSIAVGVGHEIYADGLAVDKRQATSIEVLKT